MKSFLIAHRRHFHYIALACAVLTVSMLCSGCGVAAWLTNAGAIIATMGESFTTLAAFVASLMGNSALASLLTTISKWITTVQTGIADLQTYITQYKASPTTGLLAKIEQAMATLKANVATDFSNLGLPASILNVIAGIAGLAANLLAEWDLAIQGVKTAPTAAEAHTAFAHLSTVAENLPTSLATYKASVIKLLTTPTGDAQIDSALAAALAKSPIA
jgi:hypothetical protein